jgi:hypothetical protein
MDNSDRSLAVCELMLRSVFHANPVNEHAIQSTVIRLRAEREKKSGGAAFLIVTGEGQVPNIPAKGEVDAGDFFVCLDDGGKKAVRGQYNERVTALLNSIVLEDNTAIGFANVSESVIFYKEDGKPIYPWSISAGAVDAYTSRPVTDIDAHAILRMYQLLSTDTSLLRVQRLVRLSFEIKNDPLRSFLAGWTAIEIFVNKTFQLYEELFFDSFCKEHYTGQMNYLRSIQDAMKNKHSLVNKFAAISCQLSPSTDYADRKIFADVKKIRDKLFHGDEVDESNLPVKEIYVMSPKTEQFNFVSGLLF